MPTQTLKVDDLALRPDCQVRERLDEDTVARYAEVLDALPPVRVVALSDGQLVLTDGFHRLQAHLNAGRATIRAQVREGSLSEAVAEAAQANATHGLPLTNEERDRAILMLYRENVARKEIVAAMGCSPSTVDRVLHAYEVSQVTPTELSKRHLAAIHHAAREDWSALVEATEREGWSARETEAIVREYVSADASHRRSLLSGTEAPVARDTSGAPVLLPETLKRAREQATRDSGLDPLYGVLQFAHLLRRRWTATSAHKIDRKTAARLAKEVEDVIAVLGVVGADLRTYTERLEAVNA